MTDNERILTWLGYGEVRDSRQWVKLLADPYSQCIDMNRERAFLPGKYPADANLDYLVLEKVRAESVENQVQFCRNLEARSYDRPWSYGKATDQALLTYTHGDYAEAARWLWEASQ